MPSKQLDLVLHLFTLKDTAAYSQIFHENVKLHGPASGQVSVGLSNLKKIQDSLHRVYPATQFEIEEVWERKDKVMLQWKASGTHEKKGKLKPKGDHFQISGLSIFRILKGKIVEIWQFWDRLGILEQVGEVHVRLVEPGYYIEILKKLGMETYVEKAALLTQRERECLAALLQGKTAKETAVILSISPRTVEAYLETLKKKLKCTNKGELFTVAQTLEKLELL